MKTALIQINTTVGALQSNADLIVSKSREAGFEVLTHLLILIGACDMRFNYCHVPIRPARVDLPKGMLSR